MTAYRFTVSRAGKGFLAEDPRGDLTAGGSTIDEAAERLRGMLLQSSAGSPLTSSLIVRIESDDFVAFVMRPFEKPFRLDGDGDTLYIDSLGNNRPLAFELEQAV
ncbi:MAG: hypothetical protein JO165_10650 [Candidatus Eremiobacteraeota bacterium]|nr:hypothetical protein [Candidatus Eremiobacteraeota bacterium]